MTASGQSEDADAQRWMRVAIAEAAAHKGETAPNPTVGAVVVKDGVLLAKGATEPPGRRHAEVVALDRAVGAAGATVYVTLEPCSHYGRTPPCTDRLIAARVSRVVVGLGDPNPLVNGNGIRKLRAAGIQVDVGVCEQECRRHHAGFLSRMTHKRPRIVAKVALSIDGRIATRTGDSQWISGPEARRQVHELREQVDAIIVGTGTLRADNPRLTARFDDRQARRQPHRYTLDGDLNAVVGSNLSDAGVAPSTVFALDTVGDERVAALRALGVNVVLCKPTATGRIPVADVIDRLCHDGHNTVLVEGGATWIGALVDAGLVDHMITYYAPVIIGGASSPGGVAGAGFAVLAQAPRGVVTDVQRVGPDVRVDVEWER